MCGFSSASRNRTSHVTNVTLLFGRRRDSSAVAQCHFILTLYRLASSVCVYVCVALDVTVQRYTTRTCLCATTGFSLSVRPPTVARFLLTWLLRRPTAFFADQFCDLHFGFPTPQQIYLRRGFVLCVRACVCVSSRAFFCRPIRSATNTYVRPSAAAAKSSWPPFSRDRCWTCWRKKCVRPKRRWRGIRRNVRIFTRNFRWRSWDVRKYVFRLSDIYLCTGRRGRRQY